VSEKKRGKRKADFCRVFKATPEGRRENNATGRGGARDWKRKRDSTIEKKKDIEAAKGERSSRPWVGKTG